MHAPSQETHARVLSGYLMLLVTAAFLGLSIVAFAHVESATRRVHVPYLLAGMGLVAAFALAMPGFFVVAPNMSRLLVLFGRYRGTVRAPGFYWTNPFTSKSRISLRAHTLNGKTLKVNDLTGNPIEIGAVVVWRVSNTAQAAFDVEGYVDFVETQSEAAVRQLASTHPYDDGTTTESTTSLRGGREEVARQLQAVLQERLERAGIEVLEARLSHLAYAPEIASAMLQRQQASAIIAARSRIVEGAVGMVEHALQMLAEHKVIELDDERRAQMVSNLLVVLCGHVAPTPVVNAGSLYT
jgi:regulator of protease activity HflC (stomatin/prohibitin superfamily)